MKKINLIPGTESNGIDAAFCAKKMAEQNINGDLLMKAVGNSLAPFASLLADGRGIAVTLKGDNASLIGLTVD
ncbi:MAG: hypothetical protein COB16_14395 [Rhodobacteraceae bacterium]|nr:MAG: hypothetical protein COB16_14395 [Paracoccaceae bacterium]